MLCKNLRSSEIQGPLSTEKDGVAGKYVSLLFLRGGGFFFEAGSDNRLKKGHHGAKFGAELLDGVALLALARGQEIRAARFVFRDPFLSKAAVADFGEDLAHFFARFLRDDARAGGVVAVFGGVADGIAHVAEAAAIDEVDDKLEFVHALEVGDFGLIAGVDERVEARFDQFADAAAEDGLFAEEIGLGFFGESRFENAGACAAEAFAVGERERFGVAAGVLLDGDESGRAAAFGEDFADAMAGSFGRDHGDVDVCGRLDGAEANVEAVREHQRLACCEMRLDLLAIELGLLGVGRENHDDVGPLGGFARAC